jgi:sugar lactone lactonase YvrE
MNSTAIRMILLLALVGSVVFAQHEAPNPYGVGEQWGTLPAARTWGSTSGVYPHRDSEGKFTGNIWVFERCAKGSCLESDLDPIMLFDPTGKLIRSFGSGMFVWPHGVYADHQGNLWVVDAVHTDCNPGVGRGKGHQVHKFSPEGELLMSLGTKGVEGGGEDKFRCPSDVVVSRNGDIFVTDGHNHGHGGSNRLVKFAGDGTFIAAWGKKGTGDGEFQGLHALAIDSRGRLFVGDRANQRIQILDQNGKHIATWRQFGSPSGIFIDEDDTIYVADSDSGFDPESVGKPRNPGYKRGIYIGDARTGKVAGFIPDPKPDLSKVTSGAEGVAASGGSIFGAQVGGSRGVLKYPKAR